MTKFLAVLVCVLTAAFAANAQVVIPQSSSSVLTTSLAMDPSDTTVDSVGRLIPQDGWSDEFGKSYHYIIPSASTASNIVCYPLDVKGYSRLIVQMHTSNAGSGATSAAAYSRNYSATNTPTLSVYGTTYPHDVYILDTTNIYFPMPATVNTTTAAVMTTAGTLQMELDGAASYVILHASAPAVTGTTTEIFLRAAKSK